MSALKELLIQWERRTSMQIMTHQEKYTRRVLGTPERDTTSEEEIPGAYAVRGQSAVRKGLDAMEMKRG